LSLEVEVQLDAGPYTEAFGTSGFSYTVDCRGVVYTNAATFALFGLSTNNNQVITFRNVIFDGAAGGGGAVSIASGRVVFENCTFQNFTASPGMAVQFAPTAAGAHLTITDSVFANNGIAGSGGGIYVQPSAGITAGAVIERTQFTGNTYGIVANGFGSGTALVEVRNSTIADSVFDGIWAVTQGTTASIVVEHSASVRNGGSGVNAQSAGAYVSLNDSTVAWNATGLNTSSGGTILSYKNNIIAGNLSPGVTPLSFSLQ
jgi:Right handed beta helix region